MEFEVSQIQVAKYMMQNNCLCVGARVHPKTGFIIFAFERNDKTRKTYSEARQIYKKH